MPRINIGVRGVIATPPRNTVPGNNAFQSGIIALPGQRVGFTPKNFRRLSFDLTNDRTEEQIDVSGTYIQCVDPSSSGDNAAAVVEVKLHDQDNAFIPFTPGFVLSGSFFRKIFIKNDSQSGLILDLIISTDNPSGRIDVE